MGNSVVHSVNNNVDTIFKKKKLQIVMLGLDNSGKTTLLYRMKHNQEIHKTKPTTAFNVETIRLYNNNIKFMVWDTAGHDSVRPLWRAYVRKSDAMIFVIDSSDSTRFDEARVELDSILSSAESHGIPLLILANKQDLDKSVPTIELARKLDLDSLKDSVNWHLHPTSGRYGEGVHDSLVQLADMIAKHRKLVASSASTRRKSSGTNNNTTVLTPGFQQIEASKFI